ncbi:RNA-binding protein NOB1 isoform X2 [Orussus abietinus]|uniref:RNA-binding protein NOB1 isoform X2 n=1 Tax=Orussus abietinus TaxID=222816 RepID=UPI0006257F71|nr:RNA-binding protein NOB1 isoform X2 [Orussus abietinus]
MVGEKKVEYLIVDTSAFIKNVPLQDIGQNILTEEAVVDEITNRRQLRRLVVLPYDLIIRNTFSENVAFEKETVGTEHLKTAPTLMRTIKTNLEPEDHPKPVAGFYLPKRRNRKDSNTDDESSSDIESKTNLEKKAKEILNRSRPLIQSGSSSRENSSSSNSYGLSESDYETACSDIDDSNVVENFTNLNCNVDASKGDTINEHNVDDILTLVKKENVIKNDDISKEKEEEEEEEDSDDVGTDHGWITSSNIAHVKKQMNSDILEEKPAKVACMTTDFAMQNVLMQIGLNIAALDGRVIKNMRTFILRCISCFKTTSIMTKVFCPNCGHDTLKKVAVSLDDKGNQQIHINARKPLSRKGRRFSLPTPQGGKHACNPILFEDQRIPDQRPSRLARTKTDALNDDYIAGYSPFVMRDTNSRSAILGIRSRREAKHWMRKNPNESKKKR